MNHRIEYGRWSFPADKIKNGNIHLASSLLSDSLEVNSFSAEVECGDPAILNFKRNAKLLYYPEPDRNMVWRVQRIERIAPVLYSISATSTLGLLSEGKHYGGIYAGAAAEDVIRDICGSIPVYIKGALRRIKLYGWLPIATPRDNLAQVLLAIGAALKSDMDGVLQVEVLWDGIGWATGASRMYVESNVSYSASITAVVVTEHQYIKGAKERELYSGTSVQGDIITFNEPMHSLSADGFTILKSGANWAQLSAGVGTLRGKAYIHNTREVVRNLAGQAEPNVKTVSDATLVSLVNAKAVANRLANFYQWRETINAAVTYQGEIPGDRIDMFHPFDHINSSICLQSADITLSNVLKAEEKCLVGFKPEQIEDIETFEFREVLTGSGEWDPPDGATEVVAVLISGGDGGRNGEGIEFLSWSIDQSGLGESKYFNIANNTSASGNVSATSSASLAQDETKGKPGGAGGSGGTIYRVTIPVTPHNKISYSCGAGGGPGQTGKPTRFGSKTSDLGSKDPGGYVDPITGETFAENGVDGNPGGNGGGVGAAGAGVDGIYGGAGAGAKKETVKPETQYTWAGSYDDKFYEGHVTRSGEASYSGSGGGGAGGSSGRNKGKPGGSADSSAIQITKNTPSNGSNGAYSLELRTAAKKPGLGGDGANGANGVAYGSGGDGGGGAGGIGKSGNMSLTSTINISVTRLRDWEGNLDPANVGILAYARLTGPNITSAELPKGGTAGSGAPGCIILYWGTKKEKKSGLFKDKPERIFLDRLGRRIIV